MIEITHHNFRLPFLPKELEGLRVVQLSDFHRCRFTSDTLLQDAVKKALKECGDLVLLTGDFVTDRSSDIGPCSHILQPLEAPLGVYSVLGNHDITAGAQKVEAMLEALSIPVLTNRALELPNGLWIAGLEDDRHGRPDADLALKEVPQNAPLIVMTHNPKNAELLAQRPCLALSGHTHGGQILLPFLTAREVKRIGAAHYRAGWYKIGQASLYVNRGLGQVGFPVRFLCPPEISVFTLHS